jgi:hypothetical protein
LSGSGTFANDGDAADLLALLAMMWCYRHRSWAAGVAIAGGSDGGGNDKGSIAGSGEGEVGDGGCVRGADGDVPRLSEMAPQQG